MTNTPPNPALITATRPHRHRGRTHLHLFTEPDPAPDARPALVASPGSRPSAASTSSAPTATTTNPRKTIARPALVASPGSLAAKTRPPFLAEYEDVISSRGRVTRVITGVTAQ